MLLARVVEPSAKAGWAVTYAAGRFTMDLHERIEPARIMALDARGHLEWTHESVRRWVRSVAAESRAGAQRSPEADFSESL